MAKRTKRKPATPAPARPELRATPASDWSALREPAPPPPIELFARLPVGENGERWDFDLAPWVRAVFDWWCDPAVEWIYLIQGSQTSKTTTMMGLLLWAARYDPDPAMWVGAIEEEADKFATQRLKPFIEQAMPEARGRRKRDWRRTDIRLFGRMLVHVAWATSGKRLRSWPCRYVFGDEVGIWPAAIAEVGEPVTYVKKRTRRYKRRKGIFATTPSSEDHPSWQDVTGGPIARWYVPCPQCGTFQYLDFERIRFGHCRMGSSQGSPPVAAVPQDWNYDRVVAETYYECEHETCRAHLTDADKAAMIRAGRVQYVDPESEAACGPPGRSTRALQVPATYSLFTPWGLLARQFLEAKHRGGDVLRVFITDELAQPYRTQFLAPAEAAIRACVDADRGPLQVPADAIALTAGFDVMAFGIHYVVRAWGVELRSWLVDYGSLPLGDQVGLEVIDAVLYNDYGGVPIRRAFVDSGWRTTDVYAYCRRTGGIAMPCKGAAVPQARPVMTTKLEADFGGAALLLFRVDTGHFKGWIHQRILVPAEHAGAWRLHGKTDEEYMRQILSEGERPAKRAGERGQWVQKKGVPNHYLDAEVYAAAAAWERGLQRFVRRPAAAPVTPQQAIERAEAKLARRAAVQRAIEHRKPMRRRY